MSTLEQLEVEDIYSDLNLLRIEDLGDRKQWKIVTYRDPRDGRKTRTHSALRKAIDNASSVNGLPKLPPDMIDYVWINGIDEDNYSKGKEISIDKIVPLLKEKGFDKNQIEKVDKNFARTFMDYEKKF